MLLFGQTQPVPVRAVPVPPRAAPRAAPVIKWASPRAQEEAKSLGVEIPIGFKSKSKSGKITLEDVRTLAKGDDDKKEYIM